MRFVAVNTIDAHVEAHGSEVVVLDPAVRRLDITGFVRGES